MTKWQNIKGIGVNEVASSFAFYAPSGTGKWMELVYVVANAVSGKAGYGYAWDGDLTLIGYLACPFVLRGAIATTAEVVLVCYILTSLTATLTSAAGSVRLVVYAFEIVT